MEAFIWTIIIILIIWAGVKGAKQAREEMKTGMEGKNIYECPVCNRKTAVPEEAFIDGETIIVLHCKVPECNMRIKNWAGLRYDQKVQIENENKIMDLAMEQARAHAEKKKKAAQAIKEMQADYQADKDAALLNKSNKPEEKLTPEEVIAHAVLQNKPDDLFKPGEPDEGDFYFLDIDLEAEERERSKADVEDPDSYRGDGYGGDNGSALTNERDDAEISRVADFIGGKFK